MAALATPTLRRLPLAAAATGAAALAAALVAGRGGSIVPTLVLGVIACLLLGAELLRRSVELLRSGGAAYVLLGGLVLLTGLAGWWVVVSLHLEYLTALFLFGVVGLALVGQALLAARARQVAGATPWEAIAGGPTARASAWRLLRTLGPLLLGLILLLIAARFGIGLLADYFLYGSGGLLSTAILGLVALLFGVGLAVGLVVVARRSGVGVAAGASRPGAAPPQRSEQVMAAHLHDSVLQTLALIQRQAGDPQRVAQLARQQERSLRSWLAGREEKGAATLAGAVRAAAQEVEDEAPGAVVEVVAVGDAPIDRQADAMVRAAREAMRNAVRHAGGPVRVFVEVEGGVRELFVRDTGPGFDLSGVAMERRGVRDAIIGRMEHVGGTAQIESGPAGTEIALRVTAAPPR